MDVLTVIWSMGVGACLTLGIMHLAVWLRQERSQWIPVPGLITCAALGAAVTALLATTLFHCHSLDTLRWAIRQMVPAIAVTTVSAVWFLALYLGTAQRWLAWTITNLWVCCLAINYLSPHSLTYREVTALQSVSLPWGETLTVAEGVANPWNILAHMAGILFVLYAADAVIRLFRRGDRRRALVVGGGLGLSLLLAAIPIFLIDAGAMNSLILVSLTGLGIVGVLSLEHLREAIQKRRPAPVPVSAPPPMPVAAPAPVPAAPPLPPVIITRTPPHWDRLVEYAELAIVRFDTEGRLTDVNPFCEKLTGHAKSEAIGRPVQDLLAPSDRLPFEASLATLKETGPQPHSQWTLLCASGQERRMTWSSVRIDDADGQCEGVLSVGQDITERMDLAEALRHEQERMDAILSSLNTGITLIDRELNVTWANDKLRTLVSPSDPVGETCYSLFDSRSEAGEDCGAKLAFADGRTHQTECHHATDNRWYHIVSHPIKDSDGKILQVLDAVTDITAQVNTVKQLEAAQAEAAALRDELAAQPTPVPPPPAPVTAAVEKPALQAAINTLKSIKAVQREHILHILRNTQGRVEGKDGAAHILELKPSTLRNRMHKLGITRKDIQAGDQRDVSR